MSRKKGPEGPEYRLLISPHRDEFDQKNTTVIQLETVKAFSNFQYELSVRETLTDNTIHFKVLGLQTPQLSLPSTGHARFIREFDNLNGTYKLAIEGLDGRVNTFSLRITPKQVKVLSAPDHPFVEILTDKIFWSQ
jgi:hypothetical protein